MSDLVPDSVIPHQHLPPLRYRDLPEPLPWTRMVGPSIMLAGLALGSGEFVLWPYIVYKAGFVFFWACMLGVVTQYFLNMEIERWTLATGESATTGFSRLSPHWAWVMLLLNIIPWAWPGWATGAGEILSWLIYGPTEVIDKASGKVTYETPHVAWFGIGGLWLVGIVLTAGPVVYNTVEKIQVFLVSLIVVLVIAIAAMVIRADAVVEMVRGSVQVGVMPDLDAAELTLMTLLGAIAFAGAGGTTNLGQSNFIKDKGYGMGKYIGRITSPITGQEEAVVEVGYHFPHTPENMQRWRAWWRAANIEHILTFFLTCLVCLCLMSLISYSVFYDEGGVLKPGMDRYGKGIGFIWGQATALAQLPAGQFLKLGFLVMGVAILMTTELGVLDAVARISADIVKVNYLRDNEAWSVSRLYFCFLWGEILLGTAILLAPGLDEPRFLLVTSAAMNGGVMFVYSLLLLYLNSKILSRSLAIGPWRFVALVWSGAFFGYFTMQAVKIEVFPYLVDLVRRG